MNLHEREEEVRRQHGELRERVKVLFYITLVVRHGESVSEDTR